MTVEKKGKDGASVTTLLMGNLYNHPQSHRGIPQESYRRDETSDNTGINHYQHPHIRHIGMPHKNKHANPTILAV